MNNAKRFKVLYILLFAFLSCMILGWTSQVSATKAGDDTTSKVVNLTEGQAEKEKPLTQSEAIKVTFEFTEDKVKVHSE